MDVATASASPQVAIHQLMDFFLIMRHEGGHEWTILSDRFFETSAAARIDAKLLIHHANIQGKSLSLADRVVVHEKPVVTILRSDIESEETTDATLFWHAAELYPTTALLMEKIRSINVEHAEILAKAYASSKGYPFFPAFGKELVYALKESST